MRTTINLDEDVHGVVSIYAQTKGISISAAINELVKKAQTMTEPMPQIRRGLNGFPLLPRSGRTITSEMVRKFSEDDLGQ